MSDNTEEPKKGTADLTGSNPASAAIITAGVLLVLMAVLIPTFRNTRLQASMSTCAANLKRNSAAMIMYAEENDGGLPSADDWMDQIERYVPLEGDSDDSFRCPAVGKGGYGYAMQDSLGFGSFNKITNPDKLPMLFETDNLARNAHSATALPNIPRHRYSLIAYVDGHVSVYVPGTLPKK